MLFFIIVLVLSVVYGRDYVDIHVFLNFTVNSSVSNFARIPVVYWYNLYDPSVDSLCRKEYSFLNQKSGTWVPERKAGFLGLFPELLGILSHEIPIMQNKIPLFTFDEVYTIPKLSLWSDHHTKIQTEILLQPASTKLKSATNVSFLIQSGLIPKSSEQTGGGEISCSFMMDPDLYLKGYTLSVYGEKGVVGLPFINYPVYKTTLKAVGCSVNATFSSTFPTVFTQEFYMVSVSSGVSEMKNISICIFAIVIVLFLKYL